MGWLGWAGLGWAGRGCGLLPLEAPVQPRASTLVLVGAAGCPHQQGGTPGSWAGRQAGIATENAAESSSSSSRVSFVRLKRPLRHGWFILRVAAVVPLSDATTSVGNCY